MQLIKNYFQYLQDPHQGLKDLLDTPSFKQACAGYFFAALAWVLFCNIGDAIGVPALLLKVCIVFVAELTAGCLIASLSALVLTFKKVPVSPAQLFVLVGTAGFIKGLLIAFALINAAWPEGSLWMLAPLALLLVVGLQVGYLTLALRRFAQVPVTLGLLAWAFSVVPVCALYGLPAVFLGWLIILI